MFGMRDLKPSKLVLIIPLRMEVSESFKPRPLINGNAFVKLMVKMKKL